MQLFRHSNREQNEKARDIYACFELVYTFVDFSAAMAFFVGSVLFFYEGDLKTAGVWLFVVGSLLFAAKPTIRLVREIKLYRMGQVERLAERVGS